LLSDLTKQKKNSFFYSAYPISMDKFQAAVRGGSAAADKEPELPAIVPRFMTPDSGSEQKVSQPTGPISAPVSETEKEKPSILVPSKSPSSFKSDFSSFKSKLLSLDFPPFYSEKTLPSLHSVKALASKNFLPQRKK
jgi:hypothetical protein